MRKSTQFMLIAIIFVTAALVVGLYAAVTNSGMAAGLTIAFSAISTLFIFSSNATKAREEATVQPAS
jgi:hypothetical protein